MPNVKQSFFSSKTAFRLTRAAAFLTFICLPSAHAQAANSYVVGYWEDLQGATAPVNASLLTHLNYAFATVTATTATSSTSNGVTTTTFKGPYSCAVSDTTLQSHFTSFKTSNPNLKILMSVGGAGGSELFSSSSAAVWNTNNPSNQIVLQDGGASTDANFPGNCVAALVKPFLNSGSNHINLVDGIDIDWEFPSTSTDTVNLTTMMAGLRKQLESTSLGSNALLTLTLGTLNDDVTSGGSSVYNFNEPDSNGNDLNKVVSFYNVMTYDYASGAAATPNAPLFDSYIDNTDTSQDTWNGTVNGTIRGLIARGAPASDLVLGIPFYAYQYTGVPAGSNNQTGASYEGYYQAPSGTITQPTFGSIANTLASSAKYCDFGEAGAAKTCLATWTSPFSLAPAAGAQEAWVYNPSAGSGTFTIFDDAGSIAAKVKYEREMGLAGVMVWEITGDTSAAQNPSFGDNYLLKAIVTNMQADRLAVGANAPAGLAPADVWGIAANDTAYQYDGGGWISSGGLYYISVGSDGDTWALTSSGQPCHRPVGATSWTHESGTLRTIAVGSANQIVGLNPQGSPYQWNGSGWKALGGTLAQIAVAANGDIWGLKSSGAIYHYSGTSWVLTPGTLAQIAVSSSIPSQSDPNPASYVVGLTASGSAYQWNGSSWAWTHTTLAQISVGSDGSVWGVTAKGAVYEYAAGVWNLMPGTFSTIAVGSSGNVWGLNLAGSIYQYSSGKWNSMPPF